MKVSMWYEIYPKLVPTGASGTFSEGFPTSKGAVVPDPGFVNALGIDKRRLLQMPLRAGLNASTTSSPASSG